LVVRGKLVARGTEDMPILFTSAKNTPSKGDWGNIEFTETSQSATFHPNGTFEDGSILEHVIVEYSGRSGAVVASTVLLRTARPFFNHVTVRNTLGNGIEVVAMNTGILYLDSMHILDGTNGIYLNVPFSDIRVTGAMIAGHSDVAIRTPQPSSSTTVPILTVKDTLIYDNKHGIYFNNAGTLTLMNTNITMHDGNAIKIPSTTNSKTRLNIYDSYISHIQTSYYFLEANDILMNMENTIVTNTSKIFSRLFMVHILKYLS
jgi:hypothetical protein